MKLIGIDLDGTLLTTQQKISRKNIEALKQLPDDMFPFICSGREVNDIKSILKESELALPAIGLNGAIGYDGEKKIFEYPFEPQHVKRIHSIVSAFPNKIYTNIGSYESLHYKEEMQKIFNEIGKDFSIDELNYELDYEKSIQSTPYEAIDGVLNHENMKIFKLFLFIPNRKIKKDIQTQLNRVQGISVTESAAVNLEIVPKNVSKGLVFKHIEKVYGFKDTFKVAIGDSLNDHSMFERADLGFAMKNGHELIKNMADYVTASNDEDGVSEALKKLELSRIENERN